MNGTAVREVAGVALVADPGGRGVVWYYPTRVRPETDDAGNMAVTLVMMGDKASLSVGSTLAVPQSDLSRAEATARSMADANAPLQLQPAAFGVHGARLEFVDEGGARTVVATSKSSGYPPFQAVFAASLGAASAAGAAAALRGGRGHFFVTYQVEVTLPFVTGTAASAPSLAAPAGSPAGPTVVPLTLEADLATWFPSGPGPHLLVAAPGHGG